MIIVYHPSMRESYDGTPAGAPRRLETSIEILENHGNYELVIAREASEEEILRAHTAEHLRKVQRESESYQDERLSLMASLAAGGAIMTAETAMRGEPCFGLLRPPGHHASAASYWGFCYFNNLAISLLHLKAVVLIRSAYIIDFDLHTGDGTIDILGDDPGFIIHNPSGDGDEEFLADIRDRLDSSPPVDIIAASAGFDQYEDDWGGNLSTHAFYEIGRLMFDFARRNCQGRRYGILEGGYNFTDLGKNVLAFCNGLQGK